MVYFAASAARKTSLPMTTRRRTVLLIKTCQGNPLTTRRETSAQGKSSRILALAEELAAKWLENGDCNKLFDVSGQGSDPGQVLKSLTNSGSFNSGTSEIRLFALNLGSVGVDGVTLPNLSLSTFGALGADIFINTGVFSLYDDGGSGSVTNAAATILHELGHAYNLATGLGGSKIVLDGVTSVGITYQIGTATVSAGDYNDYLINKNCNK